MKNISFKSVIRLVLFIAIIMAVGWKVGELSGSGAANEWYQSLTKSVLNPPGIAFAIVWPCLYTLMAIAGWWSYEQKSSHDIRKIRWFFIVQLLVNYMWSFIFFMYHSPEAALAWMLVLLALVVKWVVYLSRENRTLAMLQIPYIAWLCFATYLTSTIVFLN